METLTLHLSAEAAAALEWIATKRGGVSVAEVIRRAIGTERFIIEQQESGGRLLVQDAHGLNIRELILDGVDHELRRQMIEAEQFLREADRRRGCTSFIQRKLGIGYNRAALITQELVKAGVLTEADATGERHLIGTLSA